MTFKDRADAALQLAQRLAHYRGLNPLIQAIPRGAVPMAAMIAEKLAGDVDVVLAHKLGAPGHEELAIGSIDEDGLVYLADHAQQLNVSPAYIEEEKRVQVETLRRRRKRYTETRPLLDPKGRIVVVVDDGIATGSTMIAALRSVRGRSPQKLIAATAVAPPEAVRRIAREADEVVCLLTPEWLRAVGQFFEDFSPVTDDEVVEILGRAAEQTGEEQSSRD